MFHSIDGIFEEQQNVIAELLSIPICGISTLTWILNETALNRETFICTIIPNSGVNVSDDEVKGVRLCTLQDSFLYAGSAVCAPLAQGQRLP